MICNIMKKNVAKNIFSIFLSFSANNHIAMEDKTGKWRIFGYHGTTNL